MAQEPDGPTATIARRLPDLRKRRGGWSAQRLAEAMTSEGIAWDRSIVANLENGRRPRVSVQEWLCLARVLDVEPLDLLVPADGTYQVTPATALDAAAVRAWIRGAAATEQDEDVRERLAVTEQTVAMLVKVLDQERGGSLLAHLDGQD